MNPKAITAEQMYGVKSEISDDWIPGIFSTIWEKSNKRSNKWTTWITCDGPVGNSFSNLDKKPFFAIIILFFII